MLGKLLADTAFDLTVCENGQEALDLAMSDTFDVLLMDISMPVMGGLEATKALRAWEAKQDKPCVPIIALTANTSSEDRESYKAAGMNSFLAKPFKKQDLIETIYTVTH